MIELNLAEAQLALWAIDDKIHKLRHALELMVPGKPQHRLQKDHVRNHEKLALRLALYIEERS